MNNLLKKALIATTALSLCGCSTSANTDTSTTSEDGVTNVSFSIWHTFTEDQQTLLETLAQEYMDAHEGVTIDVIGGYDNSTFESTVQDAVVNGVGPQLVFNYASFANNFDGYDMLIDFQQHWDFDYSTLVAEGIYNEATDFSDNGVHAVAIQSTGPVLFYNKAVYDQLGLQAPTTWDDVKEASKTIYEETGMVGLAVDSLSDLAQVLILQSHDGEYVDLTNKEVLWNDETTLEWVNWWAEGVQEGYFQVAPTTGDYNSSDLNAGTLAAYIGSSAGLPYLDLSAIGGEVGVVRMPVIDENSTEVVAWNRGAIGFKKDDATDAVVADFVKYFIENDGRWVEVLNAYSPYYAVQEDSEYQSFVANNIALAALGSQINDGMVTPTFTGSTVVRDQLQTLFTGAADPNFDAASALQNAADLSNAAMNE